MSTPEEAMYNEALSAVRSGDRVRARDLFTRLLKTGPNNPDYWIWMSAVVETAKERAFCLNEALRLDPQNGTAKRGLVLMGSQPPDPAQVFPARFQKRNWQSKQDAGQAQVKAPPKIQLALMGVALLFLVGLVSFAIWGVQHEWNRPRKMPVIIIPTSTAVAAAAVTPTITPTLSLNGTPQPLWMRLQATYTPTALYVNTPHPIIEAYSIAMRNFQRDNWPGAAEYLKQSINISPDSPDLLYYLGEAYLRQGEYKQAIDTYNQAIQKAPDFAAAYVGRALAAMASSADPKVSENALKDFQTAIEKDPKLGEAYLGIARLQIQAKQPKEALSALEQAVKLLPGSPLVYLYRAQAYLAQEDSKQALTNARLANQMDITLLDAYRVLGFAFQAEGEMSASIDPLKTYTLYVPDDVEAWTLLAKAYLDGNDSQNARKALDKSLKLDNRQPDVYLQRAQLLMELDEADPALKDFEAALRFNKDSYEASLGAGQALMALKFPGDAYVQFEKTKTLAKTNLQKSEVAYWTAQSLDQLGEVEAALRAYRALIALPKASVQPEWIEFAQTRILALVTPTPTIRPKTATPTTTPTRTRTVTPTPTPTRTATRTPTATQTRPPTATSQPTATRQPTSTRWPTATTHP